MSWLNPSPGSSLSGSPPSEQCSDWLTPVPGCPSASSASDQQCDWLKPSPGQQSLQEPSAKHRRLAQKQPDWLCPAVGHDGSSSAPEVSVQCSEFSTASEASAHVRHIHLDMVSLLMINSYISKQSSYQVNGADSVRIRTRLSQRCKCGCMRKLVPADVISFCTHMHSLSDESVTHYFHTAYDTCGGDSSEPPSKRLRTEWYFLGHHTTVECLQSLLGMSTRTFYKKCHGTLDMRKFPSPVGHSSPQSLIVDQFFCELYCSAAERLPEVEASLRNVDAHIESHQGASPDESEPLMFLNWTPHQQAMEVAGLAVSGKTLPARHLQHCRLSDLWWQFVAWHASCEQIAGEFPSPSWATFWRRWDARWKHVLHFRTTSQHSQCKVCFQCSAFLHKGRGSPDEKRRCAQEWREHLTGQYHDRLIYWHMRWFSRLRVRGVLCIIIDSMDKAKLPFPQYQWRKPKSLDRLRRPRMVVTCAWAHGFCCDFYVGHDELQPHGASAFCEVLSRTIQHVMDICRRDNLQPPEHLVIQSDNTTSQAKTVKPGCSLRPWSGGKSSCQHCSTS